MTAEETQAFNAEFDKRVLDQCVPAAMKHGASADRADHYCHCVAKHLDTLSIDEKRALPQHREHMTGAMFACIAS